MQEDGWWWEGEMRDNRMIRRGILREMLAAAMGRVAA
jgi:hypothetical protein